jgi:BirA family transcriptional regulator, biotin operon repressor / biotin---[acetyl-CoA-carboxylase] ligase
MTAWLGARRVHHDRCASTNDEALALARAGAPDGTVVIAGAQTRGRGRAGRAWYSPPGANLYLSIVLRPTLPAAALPGLTLAAGIGVCDAVRAAGVAAARLKWPNDVLAGDRKLAGILTEMTSRGTGVDAVVVGVGVDVDGRRADLPPELAAVATSIRDETGVPQDLAGFTERLLATLEPWFDRYLAGGVSSITAAWEERAALGRRVQVITGEGPCEGTAVGLTAEGGLRVRLPGGGEVQVMAGDVVERAQPEPPP